MFTVATPPAIVIPAPSLAQSLPVLQQPVPTPEWWYRPATDAEMSLGTAAQVADLAAYYETIGAEADASEIAARADEEADLTPAGVDLVGYCFGGDEPAPRELTYEREMGVMFLDEPEPSPAYW